MTEVPSRLLVKRSAASIHVRILSSIQHLSRKAECWRASLFCVPGGSQKIGGKRNCSSSEPASKAAEPEYELRRVKRRPGRRQLASFENLPVTSQVYELSAAERICPCCGVERKEMGADESWQIEYIPGRFERI